MKANVDQDLCMGCGLCAGLCESAFRMNEEGKAECYAEGDEQEVQEVIESCPVEAVSRE